MPFQICKTLRGGHCIMESFHVGWAVSLKIRGLPFPGMWIGLGIQQLRGCSQNFNGVQYSAKSSHRVQQLRLSKERYWASSTDEVITPLNPSQPNQFPEAVSPRGPHLAFRTAVGQTISQLYKLILPNRATLPVVCSPRWNSVVDVMWQRKHPLSCPMFAHHGDQIPGK